MATPLPPGYSSANYPITPDDHGGYAVIASGVGLVFILLFATIRVWTRFPLRRALNLDDLVLFASTVSMTVSSCELSLMQSPPQALSSIQGVLIFAAVDAGLGKAIHLLDEHAVAKVNKV